ncbi:hypothetical protein V2S66_32840 [Streptomyces sp. V4-01]|uniref:Uncharacterized protein n=1 Tax=Actinacidiphila polyblastidii TaxID=3110430 RepID=A0ABU7PLN6_9ACTN|nr:hypothetical protein [Streptomyces sp. V4-01]
MSENQEPTASDAAAGGGDTTPTTPTGPSVPEPPAAPSVPDTAFPPGPATAPGSRSRSGSGAPDPGLRRTLSAWSGPIAIAVIGIVAPVLAIVLHTSSSDSGPSAGSSRSVTSAASGGPGGTVSAAAAVPPTPTVASTSPTTPPPATPTAPTTPPGPRTCTPPKKVHGISAAFVTPCTGGKVTAPYFDVTLAVPAYPAEDGSQGDVWVFVKILGNGRGGAQLHPPLYATYPVRLTTAKDVGDGVWTKDLMAYQTCRDHGPLQILTYWLPAHDAAAVARWQQGRSVTPPSDAVPLDSVTVNAKAAC